MVQISAFADEISQDLDEQIATLLKNDVHYIELRGVWGKNVMQLSDEEVRRVKSQASASGIGFSAVGSPIGKFPLDGDFREEIARVERAIEIARILECPFIRIFSYFIPKGEDPATHRRQCIDQVAQLAEIAAPSGVRCALENESDIYTDTGDRYADLLNAIPSPGLVACFDFANFVVNKVRPLTDAWPLARPRVAYFHIKDAQLDTGQIVPAGEGDGDMVEILKQARQDGFSGFLTLEPHLKVAAASYGETGPELFETAVKALRKVMKEADLKES